MSWQLTSKEAKNQMERLEPECAVYSAEGVCVQMWGPVTAVLFSNGQLVYSCLQLWFTPPPDSLLAITGASCLMRRRGQV